MDNNPTWWITEVLGPDGDVIWRTPYPHATRAYALTELEDRLAFYRHAGLFPRRRVRLLQIGVVREDWAEEV